MNSDVNELAYNLLQHEYLKKKEISQSEDNIKTIMNLFPEDWFLIYPIEERIEIISIALKNDLDIRDVIDLKKIK